MSCRRLWLGEPPVGLNRDGNSTLNSGSQGRDQRLLQWYEEMMEELDIEPQSGRPRLGLHGSVERMYYALVVRATWLNMSILPNP